MTRKSATGAVWRVVSAPGHLVNGATYPFRAIRVLGQFPRLWGCVIVPIALNIVLGVGLYFSLLRPGLNSISQWVNQWLGQWLATVPQVATVLEAVAYGLVAIALFILTGLLLVQFGAILGAPWYGKLAEQIEQFRAGSLPPPEPAGISNALRDIGRALQFELKKILLTIAVAVPLLLCNFLPGVGTAIAGIGGITLAATLVCLDFLDAPLERRRLRFRTKLSLIGRTLPASASFSLLCLFLVSIPLLNLLLVPLCVVAGTLFCCDYALPQLPPSPSPLQAELPDASPATPDLPPSP